MAIRITILFLFLLRAISASGQVISTDTKDVQVARQKLQVGTNTAKWVSSITEAITSASTHRQSPTAKAVYDWVDSLFATVSGGGGTLRGREVMGRAGAGEAEEIERGEFFRIVE